MGFIDALKADRETLYAADLLRSGFLMALAFVFLWRFSKVKLGAMNTILCVGVVMVVDLVLVDKKYVDSTDFVSAHEVDRPFEATPADERPL